MSRRFIVAAEPLSSKQEAAFREFITKNGGTWWNWIGNFWLLKFNKGREINAKDIWGKLVELNPSARVFVSAENMPDWTVTDVRNTKNKGMSDWLEKHWMDD